MADGRKTTLEVRVSSTERLLVEIENRESRMVTTAKGGPLGLILATAFQARDMPASGSRDGMPIHCMGDAQLCHAV
ncbi:hypothetical protein E4U54_000517 [Claviceps lovelessii]|nr:hypothetical protein E4U54_000517 [Claviceps lovelessii]